MKTLILFTIFILGGVGLYAQIVTIPDPIFKARLIVEGVDTNNDGEIQVSEAEAFTGMLDVNGQFDDIHDLTGIEAFVNITGLDVWHNQLTSLDLSNNTALVELYCHDNQLTYLNVENCVFLEILVGNINQLTSIDLTQNIHLKEVTFSDNQLAFLDFRNGNNTNITEYFDSRNNPGLTCIFVDDAEYSENSPVWYKDPASTYVETQEDCDALGVEDISINKIEVYPNPFKDVLNFKLSFEKFPIEVSLLNTRGQDVSNFHITRNNTQINLSYLNSGMYFMIFKDKQNKKLLTKKLIKL